MLGDVVTNIIAGLVVTILSVLAAWLFRVRLLNFARKKALAYFLGDTGIENVYPDEPSAYAAIAYKFKNARLTRIMTIRGIGLIGREGSVLSLEEIRRKGKTTAQIQVLLQDPDSPYLTEQVAMKYNKTLEAARIDRHGAIAAIAGLKQYMLEGFELRLYDELPIWKLIIMDDTLFVSGYLGTGKASWKNGRYSPVYEITRGELSLFDYFERCFVHLWNKSRPV